MPRPRITARALRRFIIAASGVLATFMCALWIGASWDTITFGKGGRAPLTRFFQDFGLSYSWTATDGAFARTWLGRPPSEASFPTGLWFDVIRQREILDPQQFIDTSSDPWHPNTEAQPQPPDQAYHRGPIIQFDEADIKLTYADRVRNTRGGQQHFFCTEVHLPWWLLACLSATPWLIHLPFAAPAWLRRVRTEPGHRIHANDDLAEATPGSERRQEPTSPAE